MTDKTKKIIIATVLAAIVVVIAVALTDSATTGVTGVWIMEGEIESFYRSAEKMEKSYADVIKSDPYYLHAFLDNHGCGYINDNGLTNNPNNITWELDGECFTLYWHDGYKKGSTDIYYLKNDTLCDAVGRVRYYKVTNRLDVTRADCVESIARITEKYVAEKYGK